MARSAKRKENGTLSFDPNLKKLLTTAAKRMGISPVTLLDNFVREKLNPYGHADVEDSAAYVTTLRKESRSQTDDAFLAEIEAWEKHQST